MTNPEEEAPKPDKSKIPPGAHKGKITEVTVHGVYEGEHLFVSKSDTGAVMVQRFTFEEFLCPHDKHLQRCPICRKTEAQHG